MAQFDIPLLEHAALRFRAAHSGCLGKSAIDFSGDCENRVYILARTREIDWFQNIRSYKTIKDFHANWRRPPKILKAVRPPPQMQVLYTDMFVRCRKCPSCLTARKRMWSFRAALECKWATERGCRTWFCTYTLATHLRGRSYWDADMLKRAFTLMLKRLRRKKCYARNCTAKRCRDKSHSMWRYGHEFRYLLAVEYHKDGVPHLHALIHEVDASRPLRKRVLEKEWPFGITHFRLVAEERFASAYVTKYMSKDLAQGRIRCSRRYGRLQDD